MSLLGYGGLSGRWEIRQKPRQHVPDTPNPLGVFEREIVCDPEGIIDRTDAPARVDLSREQL
jgi:hypothetical protein